MRSVAVRLVWLAIIALGWGARPAGAQPLAPEAVPEPLRPWVPWALDGDETWGCTFLGGERLCAWPGEVILELGPTGGRFTLAVVADREIAVPLPGDAERFPREVRVDGAPRPITAAPGPFVRVGPGSHRVEGTFRWRDMPDLLPVPPSVARISLSLGGERVRWPRREESGAVWLERPSEASAVEGHFEMEAFRRIEDGAPFRVTTHLFVRAAGEPRELRLGDVILEGMVPTAVRSDLAVRLLPDGSLVAQVHAGSFSIEVDTVSASPPDALTPPAQPAPWPGREIWVWVADESLRQVELAGAPSVDPARTNLPEAWRSHRAYAVAPEHTLTFSTLRRGEPTPPPSSLALGRELWLDLDGQGYTVRDAMTGRMTHRFRLDLLEGTLGHAVVGGRDQLVTTLDGTEGVELRHRDVDLRAEWRLPEATTDLPAVAWSEDVQQLSTTLHLPPGYALLGASGVDHAPGTWVERWDLWGLFFVVLLSLAIARLYGWRWGAVALPMLVLCYHESGAPLWSWALLAAVAALRVVWTRGRVGPRAARWAYWAAVGIVVVVAVPFAADQVRFALFPQTDAGPSRPAAFAAVGGGLLLAAPEAPMDGRFAEEQTAAGEAHDLPAREEPAAQESERSLQMELDEGEYGLRLGSGSSTGRTRSADAFRQGWIDPNEVIQTGPGVPEWSFRRWTLSWSGPVAKDHRMRLFLLSPTSNRMLALLRVLLLGVLIWAVARHRFGRPPRPAGRAGAAPAAAATLVLLSLLGLAGAARAQEGPDDGRLAELRERLTRPPECVPSCVVASELRVGIEGARVTLEAVVHAGARSAYRVPGPTDAWVPDVVTVDGRPDDGLARMPDGFLFLRLEAGVHRVVMEGTIPTRDALTLAFGEPPRSIEVRAQGWEVEGVRADGRVAESIQLRRTIRDGDGATAELALEPWLVVTRRLDVGVRWTLESTVQRVTPPGSAVVVRIPLLEGESVTDAGVLTEGGEVVVTLGRDDVTRAWTSVIEPREELVLEAPRGVRWSETWTLACSPIWRCEAEGIAPVSHGTGGTWQPSYRPWPGEALTLSMSRPEAAEGQSVTVDHATLRWRPGARILDAVLDATIRTSSGGAQTITLPEGARVQALTVDGEARPLQLDGRALRVTLRPGAQAVHVEWQQPAALEPLFRPPTVELGAGAVNARVEVELPRDRWVLWTSGPSWGAAVLFWPYLALVLLIALILSRLRNSPLRWWDWALLGIGLSQIPAVAALLVAGWFFAMEHRKRTPHLGAVWFDLRQLFLVLYTLVAAGCLYAAVHVGLLVQPDTEVFTPAGGGSHHLDWYLDRTDGTMPEVSVLSLPTWVWRVVMLAWALWLAMRVIRWARSSWACFTTGGAWKKLTVATPRPAPAGAGATATAPASAPAATAAATAPAPPAATAPDAAAATAPDATAPAPAAPTDPTVASPGEAPDDPDEEGA